MSTRIPLLTLATLLVVGCSDDVAASEDKEAAVGRELVDMVDETRNFLDLTRHELIAELEERQEEFADLERQLDARADTLEREARQEWDARREEVERLRVELAAGIVDLKTDSEESWEDLRERLVEVAAELRRELAGAALSEKK